MSARLRTLLVCVVLEFGAAIGMPMRPDEIARLMQTMNQPKLTHVLPDERENGDGNLNQP
jgi:hypothetical protein